MKSITIKSIELYPIALYMVEPLKTSFGVEPFKAAVIVEVVTESGISGWGEASVELKPGYGPEDIVTGLHMLRYHISPRLVNQTIESPVEVPRLIHAVRGNHHAKAGAEAAIWDAFAKTNDMRLADLFSHYAPDGHQTTNTVTVGVSIGIQPSVEDTVAIIQKRLNEGYGRIKLKIQPTWDVELIRGIRQALPDIVLMVDANSAYTLDDVDHLKQLDEFNLLMMEQPLPHNDILLHSKLKPQVKTPICLDESITTAHDLQLALDIDAIGILNLKPARVGGYSESLKIYAICAEHELPLWVGGMMESGVGRAANIAFASLPAVNLPCDLSATSRYFDPDITEPPFKLTDDSQINVPDGAGIGVKVDRERLTEAVARYNEKTPFK